MEIKSLTGLRGVASLYVVVFHFYQYYYFNSLSHSGFYFNNYISSFFIHGYLAVDVFFMLSAFVITLSSERLFENGFSILNYKQFMRKRWIRLYPSYAIIALYGYIAVNHFHRTANFILSLTLLNPIFGLSFILGHLWSLGVEWITYLIFPVFYKISNYSKSRYWPSIIVGLGIFTLYFTAIIFHKVPFPNFMLELYQGHSSLFRCFGDYFLGMAAYLFYKKNKSSRVYSDFFSLLLVILIFVALFFSKLDIVVVILSMLLMINICKDQSIVARVLSSKIIYFLGVISYPLYLINSLVVEKLQKIKLLLREYLLIDDNYFLLIIFILICILTAFLFTYLVEKPAIASLNRRLNKRTVA